MSQQEHTAATDETALDPEELAAEGATELPDREAMSLITGPGGAGPFPVMGPPFGMPPGGFTTDPPPAQSLGDAQDAGLVS